MPVRDRDSDSVSELSGSDESYTPTSDPGAPVVRHGTLLNIDRSSAKGLTSGESCTLTWKDLSYNVGGKQLLDNLNGIVSPGELLACMGPSGAGKSTLMNCLSLRIDNIEGSVNVNGATPNPKSFSRQAAYVMQDDALLGSLTVRENMTYSAKLRLPRSIGTKARTNLVETIIKDLGLTRVADNAIGNAFVRGLSGGERRRASTGVELVTDPSILFLDEPTSGLDSTAAYQVVSLIKRLAKKRSITVVMTIHQPSMHVLEQFSKVQLLSRGRNIYFGPTKELVHHFEAAGYPCPAYHNPGDHFIELIQTDFNQGKEDDIVEGLVKFYEDSNLASNFERAIEAVVTVGHEEPVSEFANNFFYQTYVLLSRNFLNTLRYVAILWIRVGMYAGLAFLTGTVWIDLDTTSDRIQDRLSCMFWCVAFLCFMAVAAVPAFIEDRLIFERERANGAYSTGAYVLANAIVGIPIVCLITLVFQVIAYWAVDFTSGGTKFGNFYLFLTLAVYVSESMMVFISTVMPNFILGLAAAAGANGFFMMVQGYYVRADQIPGFWLWGHWASYQKYSFEAMAKSDLEDLEFPCADGVCKYLANPESACHPQRDSINFPGETVLHGKDILCELTYEDVELWEWALVLIGMALFWRFATYAVLKLKKMKY